MRTSLALVCAGCAASIIHIGDEIHDIEGGLLRRNHILGPMSGKGHATFSYSSSSSVTDGLGHTRSSSDALREESGYDGVKRAFEGQAVSKRNGKVTGAGIEADEFDGQGARHALARSMDSNGKVKENRVDVEGDADRFVSAVEKDLNE